jgi:hypothetical protein
VAAALMRILLRRADAALETALLRAGHAVRVVPPANGALAGLAAWSGRRAAAAFAPERIVAEAEDAEAARLAERLGARVVAAPDDTGFLVDPFLPAPFRAESGTPTIGRFQPGRPEPGFVALPPDGRFLVPPDIAILAALSAAALPHWMAAGCAIVAPDGEEVRRYLEDGDALLHAGDIDPVPLAVGLAGDAAARHRLGAGARAAFERRHAAALTKALALAE